MAQVSLATISGTVKDSSGAVVPEAMVVVLDQDTGISRTIKSDSHGHYSVPALPLGNYRVTGSHQGFATEVRSGIVLTVGAEAVVDLPLTVGAETQTVEVTGAPPLVESTNASMGSLVDDKSIRALPLNGRSWDQLAELQPGVTHTNPGPPTGNQFNFGTGERFSVGGQRPDTNLFLLDGMDINDQANGTPGGAAGTNLGVDTILEFKIYTSSYKAEYGHSMGSVTTAVTRSGTNAFAGTLFEYIRNSALDARNYFDPGTRPPSFRRNQFGGVIGGPIKKDKLFFFGGYEGLRQGLGTTQFATVPTAQARQGNLPCTPPSATCVNGIMTIAVNPAVVPYLNLFPLPNGIDYGDGSGQFLSSPTAVTNEDNAMGRVDYQLSKNTNMFGRYTFDQDSASGPQALPFEFAPNSTRRQYATVQATTVFSAKALNNLRIGYDRTRALTNFTYTSVVTPSLSFVPGQPMGALQLGSVGATAGTRALTPIGGTNGNGPVAWAFNMYQVSDDFTYSSGKHSYKAGFDLERLQDNYVSNQSLWGVYTFPTLPRFLQGLPSNLQVGSTNGQFGHTYETWYRQFIIAGYAQDDYKASQRLTLNFGLRWEASTDPYDKGGKTAILPSLDATSSVPSGSFLHTPKKNFEPRAGLALQLNSSGKTVLRAGAGYYHNQILPFFYQINTKLPPYSALLSATNPAFPNGAAAAAAQGLIQLLVLNPNEKTPSSIQYNLSIQQQLFKNTLIEISYVGNKAAHLETQTEGDTPIPTICGLGNCPAGIPAGAPYYPANAPRRNPFWNGIRYWQANGDSEYNAATITLRHQSAKGFEGQVFYTYSKALDDASTDSPGASLRSAQSIMYPGHKELDWGRADFDSTHALVANFTYPLPLKTSVRGLGPVVNGWKLDGIGTFEAGQPMTMILSTSQSRNLSTAGLADRPNLNLGFSNNPIHGKSAGCTGFAAGTQVGTPQHWFDPCAFSLPIAGTYGNVGRNTVIGPGLEEMDFALEKDFKVSEWANVTFKSEVFNILNHANFGLPNATALASTGAANGSAGVITLTSTSSRQLQFALRINFKVGGGNQP
ncbi:MAG TPA: TonB-dependent receptor [Acidobacteriaceae bacterium]